MTKITGATGLVFDGENLKNPSTGTVFLNRTKIRNRATGASYEIEDVDMTSKEAIYSSTRPKDWMPMVEPEENEIYMLVNIYDPIEYIAFYLASTDYKVEFGYVKDGKFVADESKTVNINIYKKFEYILNYDDFTYELSDGAKQVMLKVTGDRISSFEITPHSQYENETYFGWGIVELWCNSPEMFNFVICQSYTGYTNQLNKLAYLKVKNKTRLTNARICNLISLKMLLEFAVPEDVSGLAYEYFCYNCPSLLYIPKVRAGYKFTTGVTTTKLKKIELEGFENVAKAEQSFQDNKELEEIVGLNTVSVSGNMTISNCFKLKKLEIDTSSMNDTTFTATNLSSLKSLIFKSTTGLCPKKISLNHSGLDTEALVKMMESLPYTETAKTLTISNTKGIGGLTDADLEEITAKGWTVVL